LCVWFLRVCMCIHVSFEIGLQTQCLSAMGGVYRADRHFRAHHNALGLGSHPSDNGLQRYAIHLGNCMRSSSRTGRSHPLLSVVLPCHVSPISIYLVIPLQLGPSRHTQECCLHSTVKRQSQRLPTGEPSDPYIWPLLKHKSVQLARTKSRS